MHRGNFGWKTTQEEAT